MLVCFGDTFCVIGGAICRIGKDIYIVCREKEGGKQAKYKCTYNFKIKHAKHGNLSSLCTALKVCMYINHTNRFSQ